MEDRYYNSTENGHPRYRCNECGDVFGYTTSKLSKVTDTCGECRREIIPLHIPPVQQAKYYFKLKEEKNENLF